MTEGAWGDDQTRFFFELTPDRVLAAVEASGFLCTGRCMALNSFENRVYDVELEVPDQPNIRRVVKFYRPGRWSKNQILEEHQFLKDLRTEEIPAIAPLPFPEGETLMPTEVGEIWYSVFPKVGGRAPDELTDDQLRRIGRLLARIHNVGAREKASHRVEINGMTYGLSNLKYLLAHHWVPLEFQVRYQQLVEKISENADIQLARLSGNQIHRIHGDCHLGNLLWNQEGPFFLDFDDMLVGPAVQDIWLLVPGRDGEAVRQREVFLEGYEEMRSFDRLTLKLIEPLRALRYVHYAAWIARRWDDPAFPQAFPQFGTHRYWADQTADLEEQCALIGVHG